jgi:transcriptional regulator with XRE-family HTH domain
MNKSVDIGKRLRLAREQAGLSQSQVAKLLGVHRPTISEMEAGRRKVTAEELSELARIYDVRMGWLAVVDEVNVDERKDRIEFAARQLSKMSDEDLDKLLNLLSTLRQERMTNRRDLIWSFKEDRIANIQKTTITRT